ncbi:Rho GTPase activation protein, partial [Blastocladiella britannica]
DVNVVTGTLKLFLRELVDPVLMCELYGDWVAAGKLQMGPARCTAVEALLARLPQAHLTTLHALVKHLARLAVHSEATKMDPSNLAIVFGPTLVRPKVESMETILNTEPQNAVVADLI